MEQQKSDAQLIREFFGYCPDYELCRTLVFNIRNGVLTYAQAVQNLARKATAARENRESVEEKLNLRAVEDGDRIVVLKDQSIWQLLELSDAAFEKALSFYFKHPYAHGRTLRSRWLPRWVRTCFLRVLFGHARSRQLDVDYPTYLEILRLL